MRVLVTWGSKLGGTEGIGRILAEALAARGFDVCAVPADRAPEPDAFDAAVIGGALYANRWPGSVRRFVGRNVKALRKIPVWLFSSGPLDDSAEKRNIDPSDQVAVLAERIGAQGHVTFGGRLEANVRGFPARAVAREHAGDWRNPERIRAWAAELAVELPQARPKAPTPLPARSWVRSFGYAIGGWALCGGMVGLLLWLATAPAAIALHAIAAPTVFTALASFYFGAHGARDPLPTAATWAGLVLVLDRFILTRLVPDSSAVFESFVGLWLPLGLVFAAIWTVGALRSTMPWDEPSEASGARHPS